MYACCTSIYVAVSRCALKARLPPPPPPPPPPPKKKKKSNMLKNFLELRCVPGVCLYVSNKFHARNMQIKHDLKQTCYYWVLGALRQVKCRFVGHAHLTYRKFYTHVHHINFEKCMPVSISFWVSCMLQFNTFLSLSCEEFVRIHHICEELFFNI